MWAYRRPRGGATGLASCGINRGMSGDACPVRGKGRNDCDAQPSRAVGIAWRGDPGRRAGGDLPGQPVPAQFGRRHRAGPRGGDRAFGRRDRAVVERVLLRVRGRAAAARHRDRPLRAEALHAGVRGDRVPRHAAIRHRDHAGRTDRGARADGARLVVLPDGTARALCAPLSARTVHGAGRHPARDRHRRHAVRDRAARLGERDDRLARDVRGRGGADGCVRHAGRCRGARGRQGSRASGLRRDCAGNPQRHARSRAHAGVRAAVPDAGGVLFELRAHRRALGRAFPHACVWIRAHHARRAADASGDQPHHRRRGLGPCPADRRRLQAAGADGRAGDRRARLAFWPRSAGRIQSRSPSGSRCSGSCRPTFRC